MDAFTILLARLLKAETHIENNFMQVIGIANKNIALGENVYENDLDDINLDVLVKENVDASVGIKIEPEIDLIVWDLETTGFVAPEARILEIGAFIFRGKELEIKHWVINENIDIPEKIVEITGITKAIVEAEGRNAGECLVEFLSLLTKAKRNVTHNGTKFDIPFLASYAHDVLKPTVEQTAQLVSTLRESAYDTAVCYKANKLGMKQREGEKFIDFAKRVMDVRAYGVKFNLALCCEEEGIDLSGIDLHRALADVAMTYEILKKTAYGMDLASAGIGS